MWLSVMPGTGCVANSIPPVLGRDGEDQLEILAVAQGVLQRRLRPPSAAPRAVMGIDSARSTAPQPLSSQRCATSAARPSLMSIMACRSAGCVQRAGPRGRAA